MFQAGRAAFAPLEESKVVSPQPLMFNSRQLVRGFVFGVLLAVFSTTFGSRAYGQDFSLTASDLHPVNPGGSSIATLDLEPSGGFNGAVSFTAVPCTVTPVQTSGTPVCLVSPDSATPPAQPSLTVTTVDTTPAGTYLVTVTGTSGALAHSVTLSLGVTPLAEDYTLSVSPTTASPSPVPAGSIASTTVTVSPIGSYSGHTVTLACFSVSPVVNLAPVCSFSPAKVMVTSGTPPTSVLSLITYNPNPTTKLWNPRIFYALWLCVPGLGFVGLFSTGTRRKNVMGALLLLVLASGLLFLPACGSSSSTNNSLTTPKNTYTFTLTGADENGAAPSNTTTNEATVTVTVN